MGLPDGGAQAHPFQGLFASERQAPRRGDAQAILVVSEYAFRSSSSRIELADYWSLWV